MNSETSYIPEPVPRLPRPHTLAKDLEIKMKGYRCTYSSLDKVDSVQLVVNRDLSPPPRRIQ